MLVASASRRDRRDRGVYRSLVQHGAAALHTELSESSRVRTEPRRGVRETMRSTLSSSCSHPAFRSSPRGPEPPPEAPYVHRPHSVHPRRGVGVKGGVAAVRSEGTLDAAEL